MTSRDLEWSQTTARDYERPYDLQPAMAEMARLLSTSPIVPDPIRGDAGAVFSILVAGHGLHMNPAQALQAFDLIKGKPYLRTEVMLALFLAAGHTIAYGNLSDRSVTVRCTRGDGRATAEITYTHAMAERAGLTNKDNWRRHPQEMLTARAVRAAMRMTAPDVFLGAISDDDSGQTTHAEPPTMVQLAPKHPALQQPQVVVESPLPDPPAREPAGVVIPLPAETMERIETQRKEAPITRAQIARIGARLTQIDKAKGTEWEIGSKEKDAAHKATTLALAGKPDLDSRNKLTMADGTHVIKELDRQLAEINAAGENGPPVT